VKFIFLPQQIILYILGGAALAITLLYILKLRRRRVEVPFAQLWQRILAEKQTSALWRKLRRLFSLLIAIFIAALLAFAAGDPRKVGLAQDGRTIVLLIDSSASMQAADSPGKNRLQRAKEEAKKITSDLGRDDFAMIARFDSQIIPLTPFEQDERLLAKAIDTVNTSDTRGDVLRAISFAADSLRGRPNPMIVVLSDGAFGPEIPESDLPPLGEAKLRMMRFGVDGENVGITAFNARRQLFDRLSYELYLELKNYGQKPQEIDLTLYLGSRPFDAQRILVQPGSSVSRFYTPDAIGIDANESQLTAKISYPTNEPDSFPADDAAYALIPKRQKVKVLLAAEKDNFFLEGVFYGEGESLTVDRKKCKETSPEDVKNFTVIIFDNCSPDWAKDASGNFLYFNPPDGPAAPFKRGKEIFGPVVTKLAKKNILTRWVTFVDVTIASARPFLDLKAGEAIVEAKEGALIAARRQGERKVIAWGFDLAVSDLPLRIAFPILIQNMLAWFTDDDATFISNYQTGQTWYVPIKSEVETAEVVEPGGQKRAVPIYDHRAIFTGKQSGFYQINAGSEKLELAANLIDEVESTITPPTKIPLPKAEEGGPDGGGALVRQEIWIALILGAIGILLLEWWTFHRRFTV
jgi:hypothetical protein